MSKSKKWLALFFGLLLAGIVLFMAINFTVDPAGYFTVERGAEEVSANGYTRAAKSKYISKHADEYNAAVLGGSKAGVLDTELLSGYSGKNYYNFYIAYGCFSDVLFPRGFQSGFSYGRSGEDDVFELARKLKFMF